MSLSLEDILNTLDDHHAGIKVLSGVEYEEYCLLLTYKVDSCKIKLDEWGFEIKRRQRWVEEDQKKIELLEKKIDRLKEYVGYAMLRREKKELKGDRWRAVIAKSKRVIIDPSAPPPQFGPYVTLIPEKFKYSKTKIGEKLEKGEKIPWAHIEEHHTARFK